MKEFFQSFEALQRLTTLEASPGYYDPPVGCPLDVHQSILRKLNHCDVIHQPLKKSCLTINFDNYYEQN